MPQTIQKITLDWFTSLFFWCFLPVWHFYILKNIRRCKIKLEWSGERKELGMVSITLRCLQLVNLLTVLSRFCIERLHALFHFSENWALHVKGEGTGETGNNWFKVLQALLKGMSVPLGSWLRFSHIYQQDTHSPFYLQKKSFWKISHCTDIQSHMSVNKIWALF